METIEATRKVEMTDSTETRYRILLADDHILIRDMIGLYLENGGNFDVTSAASLDEAVDIIEAGEKFSLVILDYLMPGMNGLQGLEKVMRATGGTPVALLSGMAKMPIVNQALEMGAVGFMPKTMSANSMVRAVRFMIEGENFVPLDFIRQQDDELDQTNLRKRELEVLRGIGEGLSNKEIAIQLDVHETTVKAHVKSLCKKLGAKNRTQAAMQARELSII